jgi:Ca2+-binding RTX toxin-like protein
MLPRFLPVLLLLAIVGCAALAGGAVANTSHAGWPAIDGVLKMHKQDQSTTMRGTGRNDELLGGHGSDTIWGRDGHDVLWGDYKPSGQNETQVDHLNSGAGNDFVYASHGRNVIRAGAGDDTVHAHFGRGIIDCGAGRDIAYVSRKGRKGYTIRHCETISHKTLGY